MRILGLDYGTKTVGVAMSDPLLLVAQGIEIIRRDHENKLRKTYARIEELIKENGVEKAAFMCLSSVPLVREADPVFYGTAGDTVYSRQSMFYRYRGKEGT